MRIFPRHFLGGDAASRPAFDDTVLGLVGGDTSGGD